MSPLLFSLLLVACAPVVAEPRSPSPLPPTASDLTRFLPEGDLEGDGRRTVGQLPRNLGRSFAGVFTRESLSPLLLGTAAAGSAYFADPRARSSFSGRAPGISQAASTAGGMSVMLPATIGLFVAGRFGGGGRFRAFSYDATQAVVVNNVYTTALKKLAMRTRPDGSDRLSFPSGHTSTAFAWATVAQAHYGWKTGLPSYLAAGVIGLSRVTNDKHHLSDVIVGATIGYVTARAVVRANGEPATRKKTFTLHPMSDGRGTGVGLGAAFSW